MTGVRIK